MHSEVVCAVLGWKGGATYRAPGGQQYYYYHLKETVSPDTELYYKFWKILSVISAGSLMVFTLFDFAFPDILKNKFYTAPTRTLTNYANLTESRSRIYVPAY
jgi:hypothetical protein